MRTVRIRDLRNSARVPELIHGSMGICPTGIHTHVFPKQRAVGRGLGSLQSTGPGEKASAPGLSPIPWVWGKEEAGPIFPSPVPLISCRARGSPEAWRPSKAAEHFAGGQVEQEGGSRETERDRQTSHPITQPFPPSFLPLHPQCPHHPD